MSSGDDWYLKYVAMQDDYNAAINFALDSIEDEHEALAFLETWREGDWPALDAEYPEFKISDNLRNPQP